MSYLREARAKAEEGITYVRDGEALGGALRYRVELDGKPIGHIEAVHVTKERRSPGKRYVSARWTKGRPEWLWQPIGGKRASFGLSVECRWEAVERLRREVLRA